MCVPRLHWACCVFIVFTVVHSACCVFILFTWVAVCSLCSLVFAVGSLGLCVHFVHLGCCVFGVFVVVHWDCCVCIVFTVVHWGCCAFFVFTGIAVCALCSLGLAVCSLGLAVCSLGLLCVHCVHWGWLCVHWACCVPVDDALEQFLAAVSSKVKGRRPEVSKRAIYTSRRMRCGAPSVTRQSFSDADLMRFERE